MNTMLIFVNGIVSVGSVFASSWGYEQTNVSFYQVISVHGKKTVTVREIRAEITKKVIVRQVGNVSFIEDSLTGYKLPILNDFIGEPLKRQVKDYSDRPVIHINDYKSAYITDLEEKHSFTSYA